MDKIPTDFQAYRWLCLPVHSRAPLLAYVIAFSSVRYNPNIRSHYIASPAILRLAQPGWDHIGASVTTPFGSR